MHRVFLAPGVLVGALACGGALASAFGYPVLGAFLSDPATAQAGTQVAAGLAALLAGYLAGPKAEAP